MVRGGEAEAFDEGDAAVFVAGDEIVIAVLVPVEGDGDDHLEFHADGIAGGIG